MKGLESCKGWRVSTAESTRGASEESLKKIRKPVLEGRVSFGEGVFRGHLQDLRGSFDRKAGRDYDVR